eukprot:60190-Chlamydomonas_euryale.AAC.3
MENQSFPANPQSPPKSSVNEPGPKKTPSRIRTNAPIAGLTPPPCCPRPRRQRRVVARQRARRQRPERGVVDRVVRPAGGGWTERAVRACVDWWRRQGSGRSRTQRDARHRRQAWRATQRRRG